MMKSKVGMFALILPLLLGTTEVHAAVRSVTMRQTAEIPAIPNTFFGLVLPVHRPNATTGAVCGPISEQDIVKTEAFFWALRTYTSRSGAQNGNASLPAVAFDSCGSADRTYEHLEMVEDGTGSRGLSYIVFDKSSVTLRTSQLLSRKNTIVVSAALNNVALKTSTSYYLAPSADQEAQAIVEVLSNQGWQFVQVLYVDDEYGQSAIASFKTIAKEKGITITNQWSLSPLPSAETPELESQPYVVVVFAYAEQKGKLRRDLRTRDLVLLTTNVADDYDDQITGDSSYKTDILELRTEPTAKYQTAVQQFREYMKDLTWVRTESTRYAWFDEFWQNKFTCSIPGPNSTCDRTTMLGGSDTISESSTALIIQAVDMMVSTLISMCGNECQPDTFNNHKKKYNAGFQKLVVEDLKVFDGVSMGPASREYMAFLHQGNKTTLVGPIDRSTLYPGRMSYQSEGAIIHRPVRVDSEYGTRSYIWWIAIAVLASVGILLVLIIAILLAILVTRKARISYVWLYAVLLFGAFLGYLTLYAYIFVPTTATCGITRFGVGFSYAVCFAVMVVLALILCKKTEMFPTTAVSTIFIAVCLVLLIAIELVILIIWLVWTPPGVSYVIYRGTLRPMWICNHYTLGTNYMFLRTGFENHLLHLVYVMLLILVVLVLAIFIFTRRKYLSTGKDKMESYALLAAGIGTGIGTVAIWLVWTLVGALGGVSIGDVHNYGEAAMAFGLWFTLTWLLLFLLLQIIYAWRSTRTKLHKSIHENKFNLTNVQTVQTGVVATSTVDGNLNNHHTSKEILMSQPNGGATVTTNYEQRFVETKVGHQNMGYQDVHVMEQPLRSMGNEHQHVETKVGHQHMVNQNVHVAEQPHRSLGTDHQHVFSMGSNYCAECGFAHDPHALRLVHPRSEHTPSVHDNSMDYTANGGKIWEGMGRTDGMSHSSKEIQSLHLRHPRAAQVARHGSLDMTAAGGRHMMYAGNSRYARSEIGGTYVSHGTNIVDLRRQRHPDKVRYIPANHNANVYFTGGSKGTSVI